jgi:hypothetical protein
MAALALTALSLALATAAPAATSGEDPATNIPDGIPNGEAVPPATVTLPVDPPPVVAPPPDETAPFAGVTILTRRARLDSKGRAAIKLSCPAAAVGACQGTLSLKARKAAGSKVFSILPGRNHTIRVKLSKAARKALVRKKRLKLSLTAFARDGTEGFWTATGTLTLRPAKTNVKR